jgi:hypothetical protein
MSNILRLKWLLVAFLVMALLPTAGWLAPRSAGALAPRPFIVPATDTPMPAGPVLSPDLSPVRTAIAAEIYATLTAQAATPSLPDLVPLRTAIAGEVFATQTAEAAAGGPAPTWTPIILVAPDTATSEAVPGEATATPLVFPAVGTATPLVVGPEVGTPTAIDLSAATATPAQLRQVATVTPTRPPTRTPPRPLRYCYRGLVDRYENITPLLIEIDGRVLDRNGRPQANVLVRVSAFSFSVQTRTDVNGNFQVHGLAQAINWNVDLPELRSAAVVAAIQRSGLRAIITFREQPCS